MNNRFIFKYQPAGVVRINGEDAFEYLQSQFSNDLRPLKPLAGAIWGFLLNRKGGAVADGFIVKLSDDDYRIFSYHTPSDAILTKLEENIIADDVECTIESNWHGISAWGDFTQDELQAEHLFKGRRIREGNWELLSQQPISLNATEINLQELHDLRISGGVGAFGIDLFEGELPQECAMTDGISIEKGCYLGQEIMSRLENIGGVRKSLYILQGSHIKAPLTLHEKPAGALRSLNQNSTQALAILKDRLVEGLSELDGEITILKKAEVYDG